MPEADESNESRHVRRKHLQREVRSWEVLLLSIAFAVGEMRFLAQRIRMLGPALLAAVHLGTGVESRSDTFLNESSHIPVAGTESPEPRTARRQMFSVPSAALPDVYVSESAVQLVEGQSTTYTVVLTHPPGMREDPTV